MKLRRTTYSLLLGLIAALPAAGQEVKWIHHMSASFWSFGDYATADAEGNFYITGYVGGNLDFGGVNVTGDGLGDIYIAKYNTQRVLQWVKQGKSGGWNEGRGIAIGADGSVTVVGRNEGQTNFDGISVPGVGENDACIARYSASGAIQWAKSGGGSGMDWANGVAVDADGNSYVAGFFSAGATFGTQTINSEGEYDIFLVSYDPAGNLRWIKSAGGSGDDQGYGVAVDAAGDVYLTGIATGNARFNGTALSGSGTFAFLAKYGSDGSLKWVKGAEGGSTSESISINDRGQIFITGSYTGTLKLGSHTLNNAGSADIFVARFDNAGTAAAAWGYGGTGEDGVAGFGQSLEIVAAADGGFFLTSSFENSMTLGTTTLQSLGMADIFVAQFNGQGEARWAISGGGADKDKFVSLGVDGNGIAYLLGNYFSPSFKMGPGTLPRFGSVDMVMAKIDGTAATGVPRVMLSKSALEIGDVVTGSSKNASLNVTAGSNVPLTVTNVYFEDPQSVDDGFTITTPTSDAFPVELSGSEPLPVTIRFAPTELGEATATLIVETNDPSTPSVKVNISANGLDGSSLPRAVISTTELNIGDVWLGVTSEKSFTISPGTAAGLTIDGIEFEDPRSIDDGFYLSNPTDFPITLEAGESVEVKVEYTPSELGEFEARLVVATNDESNPYKEVDIVANATEAPVAHVTVTSLEFGDVNVGATKEGWFKVAAASSGRLEIESIALKEEGAAGRFRILTPAPDATYPLKLSEGQEVIVTLEFAPLESGEAETTLTIETNDPLRPQIDIPVAGMGLSVSSVAGDESGLNLGPVRVMPNPLLSTGEIVIDLDRRGEMRVNLLDMSGRNIAQLFEGRYDGGEQRIALNARSLSSGLYFCEVEIDGERFHRVITISR